ncbi:hypothetical protein N9J37_00790 [Pontimonas sp.]|nr:hypothetical protein [Pontimonas sp.]MDA9116832.1 hypothetical protein [Pontimonas sp.]
MSPKRILDLGSAGGEIAERILEIPVNHEFTCVEGHYPSHSAGIERLAKFGSRAKTHHLDLSASNAIESLSNLVGARTDVVLLLGLLHHLEKVSIASSDSIIRFVLSLGPEHIFFRGTESSEQRFREIAGARGYELQGFFPSSNVNPLLHFRSAEVLIPH